MIYILLISIIASYISNNQIYLICDEIKNNKKNTLIIYITIILTMISIYLKYGFTIESIKYLTLIPFIVIISIIDYHTTYIYDITVLSGIIIQGIIFISTLNKDLNSASHISAMIIGLVLAYIISKITNGLGQGDIGLYGLCSFTLGHNYALYLISLSYIIASIYCVYILFMKSDKIRKIPFAPFISLSTIIIMMTNNDILKIYFDIIGN
ncbi:prepilin peptidase [Romboutsia lituseburensis]|uniref:prepilin peptidase n=1 Tax=Romboutsia lituseburensis TaxID=1537 RepID=UPI00215A6653|nr:prepilin peptidase [Romboutsia lituseburensis]MCR8746032.1 prepilin peptidase [Romboutsia lituseburensis]